MSTQQTTGTDNMFSEYPDIISVYDLMKMLNVCKSTAYSLLQSNQILHVRVGKKYVIPKKSVVEFIACACYNHVG